PAGDRRGRRRPGPALQHRRADVAHRGGRDKRLLMRALLFDLDGTLTRSSGAGTRALAIAIGARVRAAEELRKMRLDGMTDRAIARLLLAAERHGQPQEVPDEDIDAVLSQYLLALEKECAATAYVA